MNEAYAAPDQRSRWQRLKTRLFPARRVPIPEDLEGWAPSYIETHVVSVLDWKDRLRALVSGRIHVQTRTKTDVVVSKMAADSVIYVEAP